MCIRDSPWVFAEVIAQINDDGSVSSSVETSVDMTWYDDSSTNGSTTGSAPFNNLNIYKASLNSQTQQINYIQERVLPMLGHLEPYIDTVPYGTWPNPPTVPSAQ